MIKQEDPVGYMSLTPEQRIAAQSQPLAMKLGVAGVESNGCLPCASSAPLVMPAATDTTFLMGNPTNDAVRRKIAEHDRENSFVATTEVINSSHILMEALPTDNMNIIRENIDANALVSPEVQAVPPSTQKIDQFHPACLAAAQQEIQLSISRLFHKFSAGVEQVPRVIDGTGTCVVQALRSVGKWSIGTQVECSIMKSYIEAIENSHHFIYIENQFFIGSLAGDGVQNGVPLALVERILKAHTMKQPFRVVIIVPMHPNGDFCNAMKAKVVMHYEYLTINRGVNSLFRTLRSRAPDINISNYINFYSLRNWGVINNKIVSEQVYVHDKLLIVDDRVLIIGSANINDRSMLGARDSEVAVRIEDTLHIESSFNGVPFNVGYLPFMVRNKLMKQHVADDSIGKF
jgi:phosphatidylserine/phosphatidylglycerophosphate/cardiolipin synthase-like enzyme